MHRFDVGDLDEEGLILEGASSDRKCCLDEICDHLLDQTIHTCNPESEHSGLERTDHEWSRNRGYNLFSTCRYDVHSRELELKLNNDIEPFLFGEMCSFTTYRLSEFMKLSSPCSMQIYELIKMPDEDYFTQAVAELRALLGRPSEDESVEDLRQNALDLAQAELEQRCSTHFTYTIKQTPQGPVVNFRRRQGDRQGP